MSTGNDDGFVPPFVDEQAEAQKRLDRRAVRNTIVMIVAWALLTFAMIGGAKILFDYLAESDLASQPAETQPQATPSASGVENKAAENSSTAHSTEQAKSELRQAQILALILAFVAGWTTTLISIRKLHNIFLPLLVRFYAIGVVAGMILVYERAVYKLFYEKGLGVLKYSVVIIGCYLVLVSLYLLFTDDDLWLYLTMLGLAAVIHIFAIVSHYVFGTVTNPHLILSDLYFFVLIGGIFLLLSRKQPYERLQRLLPQID